MRILQLCNKVPYPPKDGGCIAMNNLTQGLLKEGHEVKVLAVNTSKHFVDIASLPERYRAETNIEAVFIDTSVKVIPSFLNLFSSGSYNIQRFYSKEFENRLIGILSSLQFDVVQLESLFVSMYIPVIRKYSTARIVLRAHNVEHLVWERNAAAAKSLLKKRYFRFLARRLKQYELKSLLAADGIAAITTQDASWFTANGASVPVTVIPFGIDLDKITSTAAVREEKRSVFHLGAMDWQPNIDGVNWFLENVWPRVRSTYPDVKFYIAGRGMGTQFDALENKHVIKSGEVENAYEFIRSKGLMIAPLLSGGGMRVKLIEGMALEKVVVTTTIGAEGVAARNGKELLIADNPEDFAKAIFSYLSSPDFLNDIGKNAAGLVSREYNNADISRRLTEFYNSLIK